MNLAKHRNENSWSIPRCSYSLAILSVILMISGCGEKAAESVAAAPPAPEVTHAKPVPTEDKQALTASPITGEAMHKTQAAKAASSRQESSVGSAAPPDTTIQNDRPEALTNRIDAYFTSLKTAAYTFNPPSPIKVAEPVTVHLWIDPQATAAELAEELKKAIPRDAARVESGQTRWSPTMRATLSGPDFDVKTVDPEEQPVSSTQRTTWSWDITPLRAGEKLALHLRLAAVLPAELGPPKTITTLDREINVEVTWWWLFDHYFEKYWKWLLGGLGTTIAGIVAWWWKNRQTANKNT